MGPNPRPKRGGTPEPSKCSSRYKSPTVHEDAVVNTQNAVSIESRQWAEGDTHIELLAERLAV